MRLVSPRLRSADWKNMLFAVCETISGIDSSLFRQKAAAEYLLSCRSFYLLFQRFLNFFDHDPKRLQPCIFLIYGFQNVPWCISSAGFLKHLIYCCFILIPFFTVSPVLIRDLPLFFRIALAVVEPGKLGVLINVDPKFHDHSAPVRKLLLKFIDLIVGTRFRSGRPSYHHSLLV